MRAHTSGTYRRKHKIGQLKEFNLKIKNLKDNTEIVYTVRQGDHRVKILKVGKFY